MPPTVTVIILAYREPAFLNALLGCVVRQTLPPAEILVIDDASGGEFLGQYQLPPQARLIVNGERLANAAKSRNIGLREARSDFIAFVDQDDLWEREKLAIQAAALEADAEAVMHRTHVVNVDEALVPLPLAERFVPLGSDAVAALVRKNTVVYSSVMMRREAALRLGGFDEAIRGTSDWDMWLRVAAAGRILEDERALTLRRWHARQWSKSRLMIARGATAILAKAAGSVPGDRGDLRRLIHRRRARWFREQARWQLKSGEGTAGCLGMLGRSAMMWPLSLRTYVLMVRVLWSRCVGGRATASVADRGGQ